jgi:hypothetical protein
MHLNHSYRVALLEFKYLHFFNSFQMPRDYTLKLGTSAPQQCFGFAMVCRSCGIVRSQRRRRMATFVEGRRFPAEAEPLGLLSEGAAGIATVVLSVIALAGISSAPLASIVTIVVGVGLMVQAFNSTAERFRAISTGSASTAQSVDLGAEVMVDVVSGFTGLVLGIVALVGVNAAHLVPAALIVFGGALLLSGGIEMISGVPSGAGQTSTAAFQSSAATGGLQIMVGIAAIVLGILALTTLASWVLVLVGFIAIGAALLMVSATFSGAVTRLLVGAA